MPKGMQTIYSTTLSTVQYTVSFNNIPQTYTDLKIVISGRTDAVSTFDGGPSFFMNGNVSGNLASFTAVKSNGSSTSSQRTTDNAIYIGEVPAASTTSGIFGAVEIYIPEYTAGKNKQVLIQNASSVNNATAYLNVRAGLFKNPSSVTSIGVYGGSGNWVAGSTFTLYGISR